MINQKGTKRLAKTIERPEVDIMLGTLDLYHTVSIE
jgi:hypothetical protein